MVYSNKLVAVVKVDGNIIREDNDLVNLPFGSEYSIYLKNLGLQDVVVNVDIDGKDVLSGNKIIIPSKETHELLGYLNGNQITNRFKFIQKTDNIVKHRGDRIDDGFINISFQFEKQYVFTCYPSTYTKYDWSIHNPAIYTTCGSFTANSSASSTYCSTVKPDEGITVRGTGISKKYDTRYVPLLEEQKHSIIIRLKGYTNSKPIFTNTKLICETCGKSCRSNMKFCPECGTSLI
jgi:hypothetical protein